KLGATSLVVPDADSLDKVWDLARPGDQAFTALHQFDWLRHLAPLQETGREAAQRLVRGWLDRFSKWDAAVWAPDICAERLTAWAQHHALFLKDSDVVWRSRTLAAFGRQLRHLARSAHRAAEGAPRLRAAMGLTLAGLCIPHGEKAADRGLELTRRELQLQILPDGGHISRNPSLLFDVFLRLRAVSDLLTGAKKEPPGFLRQTLDRMAPMVSYFRHGDGRLALFHGGTEDDGAALDDALRDEDLVGAPFGFAPHTGFQRLSAGRSLLIMDVGKAPPAPYFDGAHDSATAFEFSAGRHRLIVNCGAAPALDDQWRSALRRAEAHSRSVVQPKKAPPKEWAGSVLVETRRYEEAEGFWLEVEQVGGVLAGAPEALRRRRVFLSALGDDLRGEDSMNAPLDAFDAANPDFIVRFHLHPSVKASLARDKKSVLLIAPSGEGWRFRSDGVNLAVEKSVYLGDGERPRPCEQIVLHGGWKFEEGRSVLGVRWALQKMGRRFGAAQGA
ncbi:MAG: heparinase II/III family protein, partial [Pseudomonadota bacterium]